MFRGVMDILIEVEESLGPEMKKKLLRKLLNTKGVAYIEFQDDNDHVLDVELDPHVTNDQSATEIIRKEGLHPHLFAGLFDAGDKHINPHFCPI